MTLVERRDPVIPLVPACRAFSLSLRAFYVRRLVSLEQPRRNAGHDCVQPLASNDSENQSVPVVLNNDEFCDEPPYEVYHQLFQQAIYLCWVSTMYRLLRRQRAVGERRKQRPASITPFHVCSPPSGMRSGSGTYPNWRLSSVRNTGLCMW
jgi:hypothetical protein